MLLALLLGCGAEGGADSGCDDAPLGLDAPPGLVEVASITTAEETSGCGWMQMQGFAGDQVLLIYAPAEAEPGVDELVEEAFPVGIGDGARVLVVEGSSIPEEDLWFLTNCGDLGDPGYYTEPGIWWEGVSGTVTVEAAWDGEAGEDNGCGHLNYGYAATFLVQNLVATAADEPPILVPQIGPFEVNVGHAQCE